MEAILKKFYAFAITNESSCMGQYYGEDDWTHLVYDETLNGLVNKAAKLLVFESYYKPSYRMYQFECMEIDGELYGRLDMDNSGDFTYIHNFFDEFKIKDKLTWCGKKGDYGKTEALKFKTRVENSDIFKKYKLEFEERQRVALEIAKQNEERKKIDRQKEHDASERRKYEELKKKYGD